MIWHFIYMLSKDSHILTSHILDAVDIIPHLESVLLYCLAFFYSYLPGNISTLLMLMITHCPA